MGWNAKLQVCYSLTVIRFFKIAQLYRNLKCKFQTASKLCKSIANSKNVNPAKTSHEPMLKNSIPCQVSKTAQSHVFLPSHSLLETSIIVGLATLKKKKSQPKSYFRPNSSSFVRGEGLSFWRGPTTSFSFFVNMTQ